MSELTLPCARRAFVTVIVVVGITVPAAAASAWVAGALLGPAIPAAGTQAPGTERQRS